MIAPDVFVSFFHSKYNRSPWSRNNASGEINAQVKIRHCSWFYSPWDPLLKCTIEPLQLDIRWIGVGIDSVGGHRITRSQSDLILLELQPIVNYPFRICQSLVDFELNSWSARDVSNLKAGVLPCFNTANICKPSCICLSWLRCILDWGVTIVLLLQIFEPRGRKMDDGFLIDHPTRAILSNLLRTFYDDVCK